MPPESQNDWKRLGRLLAERRIEIAARYKNKNLFAAERQINRRMLWSIESGERDTYTPDTLRDIERAYMLVPGSMGRTLAGGDLEPVSDRAPAPVLRPVPPPALAGSGSLAESERDRYLAMYPDDIVIRAIAAQSGKKVSMVVAEMIDWIESHYYPESQADNGTAG